MFNVICKQCGKTFQAQSSLAKFHSDTCRKAFARDQQKKITETTKVYIKHKRAYKEGKIEESFEIKMGFKPNWEKKGFKSREEAVGHVLKCLYENRKKILSKGTLGETTFMLYGKAFILNKKGFKV